MTKTESGATWTVDLKAGLAACGAVLISFAEREDGFDIAFIEGANCSLEEQCLMAGQATAAIQANLRWAGLRGDAANLSPTVPDQRRRARDAFGLDEAA
jgi:hypothetical protein